MNCPLCGRSDFEEWGKVGKYSIIICKECGLGITAPFPTESELAEANREIYRVEQRIKAYLSRKSYFEKRYRGNVADIKRFKHEGRLLDVGCNIGLFLSVARDEGFSVTGAELNRECAEFGVRNFKLDIRSESLENIAFAGESFDVVTLFDVLEHVPDIHGLLAEARRILKKDGLLVVQSPNIRSLMARLTRSNWVWLTPPDHLYHFAPATLNRLLKEHGFDVRLLKSWEPAEEFSNNLLSNLFRQNSMYGKMSVKLNRLVHYATIPVLLTQKLWWRKQMGGLIELFAVKVAA